MSTRFSLSVVVIGVVAWCLFCTSCMRKDMELSSSDMFTFGSTASSGPSFLWLLRHSGGVGRIMESSKMCPSMVSCSHWYNFTSKLSCTSSFAITRGVIVQYNSFWDFGIQFPGSSMPSSVVELVGVDRCNTTL